MNDENIKNNINNDIEFNINLIKQHNNIKENINNLKIQIEEIKLNINNIISEINNNQNKNEYINKCMNNIETNSLYIKGISEINDKYELLIINSKYTSLKSDYDKLFNLYMIDVNYIKHL